MVPGEADSNPCLCRVSAIYGWAWHVNVTRAQERHHGNPRSNNGGPRAGGALKCEGHAWFFIEPTAGPLHVEIFVRGESFGPYTVENGADERVRRGVRRRRLWHGRVRQLRGWPATMIFVAHD